MDPFLAVKQEVEQNLIKAAELVKKQANSGAVFKTLISSITEDLNDLEEALNAAKNNPSKFNLSSFDISNRSDFISKSRATLSQLRASTKNQEQERNALFAKSSKIDIPQTKTASTNAKFIENEQEQQQLLMKNQDQQLDGVLNVVSNMKELASVMGNELDDQTRLLGDLEMQVDTTQSNLGHGIKKVNDFIKANASSKQQYVIACLIIGLVILIILIFTM